MFLLFIGIYITSQNITWLGTQNFSSRIEKYFTSERSEWANYFSSRLEVYPIVDPQLYYGHAALQIEKIQYIIGVT